MIFFHDIITDYIQIFRKHYKVLFGSMNEVRKGFDDFLNTFNGNKQLSTFLDFHRGI